MVVSSMSLVLPFLMEHNNGIRGEDKKVPRLMSVLCAGHGIELERYKSSYQVFAEPGVRSSPEASKCLRRGSRETPPYSD